MTSMWGTELVRRALMGVAGLALVCILLALASLAGMSVHPLP
jgi:hypothetical protein